MSMEDGREGPSLRKAAVWDTTMPSLGRVLIAASIVAWLLLLPLHSLIGMWISELSQPPGQAGATLFIARMLDDFVGALQSAAFGLVAAGLFLDRWKMRQALAEQQHEQDLWTQRIGPLAGDHLHDVRHNLTRIVIAVVDTDPNPALDECFRSTYGTLFEIADPPNAYRLSKDTTGPLGCAADLANQRIAELRNWNHQTDPPFTTEQAKAFFDRAKDQAQILREAAEGCAEAVKKLDDILGMRPLDMLTASNSIRRQARAWFDMTQHSVFDFVAAQPEPDTPAVQDFYRRIYQRMSGLLAECSKLYELAWNMTIAIDAKRAPSP